MARSPFGWGYPAGAENDPNAPWNQIDEMEECPICGEPNSDEKGKPLFDDPSFCSKTCYDKYVAMQEEADSAAYDAWKEARDEVEEWDG